MSKRRKGAATPPGSNPNREHGDGANEFDEEAPALYERALGALRAGRSDRAELMLARAEVLLQRLLEKLRGDHAALQLQNEELRHGQRETETALARFTAFFMRLPVAELVVDHHGLIIEANAEARHLLDLRDTRAHQSSLARLVHADDRGRVVGTWERLKDEQTTDLLETRLRSAAGRALVADLHIARLPSPEPLPPRYVCAVIDRSDAVRERDALSNAFDRLESREERYRVLAEFSPDWDYWLGSDGSFVHVSPACLDITGYSARQFMSDRALLERIIHPDDLPAWRAHLAQVIGGADPDRTPLELRIRTRDGEQRWIEHVCNRILSEDGRFLGRRGVNRDITARVAADQALRESERKYRTLFESADQRALQARMVFEHSSLGILITDAKERIVAVNGAFTEITGYSEQEALGETPRLLKSEHQDDAFYQAMWASLVHTRQWRGELWNRRKTGETYPQMTTINAVYDEAGQLTNYVSMFEDITQSKRSEEALYKLAHEDALTGLPNGALLRARLEQSLSRAERNGSMLGVLFLDLDMFKSINDTLGHPVGDALLQRVAEAISQRVRGADSVARLGGDEFVVLMEDIQEPTVAAQLARRLLEAFSTPFQAKGHALKISTSIGISIYPIDGKDMETLLRNADVAMYQAKEQGRNTYRFFEERMSEGALERQRLEHALGHALTRDELRLEYQPQVRLEDGSLIGTEVLLRWSHPELGQVPPSRFIPVAEDLGLIGKLGNWVLERACNQLAEWDELGFRIARMTVNLSLQQLERVDLVESVGDILARTGIAGHRLEVDVLEAVFLRQPEQVIANLEALRELGVRIAIDDFGLGFSSLGGLPRLPINRLKIDKTFVDNLNQVPGDDAVVRAIIALGRCLGLEVLAEGVESRHQVGRLLQAGCVEAQGYLFGRPMSAADLLERHGPGRDGPKAVSS
jgi:diguanylate cyclase (GGDEF)-like protein/PAS domain S-box-containing protein